ncbi:hypothetical protein PATY110618_28145 [Paenibacillus typhae]|uniref:Uncharacterized protein n=1 Tax=Paenibacillus typhae TaxID=1174501 RepID=A0A1G9C6T8_9BACL|nr:hypothetical protein SAMN05216192_1438 [Paenibacillus typhae]
MNHEGSLRRGLVFGLFLSIPLWMSMIGWLQLL